MTWEIGANVMSGIEGVLRALRPRTIGTSVRVPEPIQQRVREPIRQRVREPILVKELFHPLLVQPEHGVPVRRRRLPVKRTPMRADEHQSSDTEDSDDSENSDDSDYTVQESDTDTDTDEDEDAASEDDTAYDSAESGNDADL